jgi:hypothetical protein
MRCPIAYLQLIYHSEIKKKGLTWLFYRNPQDVLIFIKKIYFSL